MKDKVDPKVAKEEEICQQSPILQKDEALKERQFEITYLFPMNDGAIVEIELKRGNQVQLLYTDMTTISIKYAV